VKPKEEVLQTLKDLQANGCDVVTIGQYLQPTKKHLPVQRFVHPDEFAEYREDGLPARSGLCGKRPAGAFFLS
jgi:lipoate synthase